MPTLYNVSYLIGEKNTETVLMTHVANYEEVATIVKTACNLLGGEAHLFLHTVRNYGHCYVDAGMKQISKGDSWTTRANYQLLEGARGVHIETNHDQSS